MQRTHWFGPKMFLRNIWPNVLDHSVQSLSQTIVIFRTDLSHFSREKLWKFQLFCQASLPNFVRRLYPKLDETLKSMHQIRDVITSAVSFTFRENEFAADKKASLPFQLLSNIFIFLFFFFFFFFFFVSFAEIGISPGWVPLIGWTPLGYTST